MARARHVIWDWNGTLLDDVEHSVEILNGLLLEHDLPEVGLERYREVFDFPVRTYYERVGFNLAEVDFDQLATTWLSRYMAGFHRCRLRSDARAALDAVAEIDVAQSVLSASEQGRLDTQLSAHDIAGYFRGCVGVPDHRGSGKLERARAWLYELKLDAREVVLVGDTAHDLEVAQALGSRCVLVLGGHHDERKLNATGNVSVVHSLLGVLDCL